MKKLLILVLMVAVGATAFAQTDLVDDLAAAFEQFAVDVTPALGSASVLGSTWSDSYIGQFPHLGAGAFVGAALFPEDAFNAILDTVDTGASLPAEIADLPGIPLPVAGVSARLGGLILPFDIGVKLGMVPEGTQVAGMDVNYMLAGADIRLPLIKEKMLLPELVVGAGVNYLQAGISMSGVFGSDYEVVQGSDVWLTDPDLDIQFEAVVFDAKAQISKKILMLRPYAGVGVSYAMTSVNGALVSELVDGGGNPTSAPAGYEDQLDAASGFAVALENAGYSARVYAGAGLSLLFIKLDVGASYDVLSESLAGEVGLRIQF